MVKEASRSTHEVLLEALPGLVAGIKFEKSMRWNSTNIAFSRPIRWLLALLGSTPVPFEYAGYTASNTTRGLRFYEPETFTVASIAEYLAALKKQGILIDPEERKAVIREQVKQIMLDSGAEVKIEEALLDEVTQLVEAPTALRGGFDPEHLKLPPEVLISVMKKHQRYFPVQKADGSLLPYFIAVRNGDRNGLDTVADGNEQVIRARFADAAFFINEDLNYKLEDELDRLGTLTFQQKLGSMLDKSKRIEAMMPALCEYFKLSEAETKTAQRAAKLCKADLVTHMVVEMTSLQGIMGKYYALHSGESQEVAQAIFDHYLPRFTGDALPSNKVGMVIGLADRLDSLAGLFAAGLAPTGTKDPFAQRRAALGLVQTLAGFDLDFDLAEGIALASQNLPITSDDKTRQACLEFIEGRLKNSLTDAGYRYDVVDAILAEQAINPAGAVRAVKELSDWVTRANWSSVLQTYSRCVRITRDQKVTYPINVEAFEEDSERDLYAALQQIEKSRRLDGSVEDLMQAFLPAMPVINRFFDSVLVMAEEQTIRANRLGLLQKVSALAKGVADFSVLEGF
jgi:glycyl-tRNA synthetase